MTAEQKVDALLKHMNSYQAFKLYNVIIACNRGEGTSYPERPNSWGDVYQFLIDNGFAEWNTKYSVKLNDRGRELQKVGSYQGYLNTLSNWEIEQQKLKNLEIKKKEWDYKTRKWPLYFSAVAVLISLGALSVSITTCNDTRKQRQLEKLQTQQQTVVKPLSPTDSTPYSHQQSPTIDSSKK